MEISNKLIGQQLSLWTSFAEDIPVSHSAPQASEKEQTTLDTYGLGSEQPLASYDPSTQSWRMSEDISLWGDYRLLESLPKSGMTRNGVLYQQPDWVRPIAEIASSLWPTPVTVDAPAGPAKKNPNLIDAVRMRPNLGDPAPTTQEFREQRMWPTPTARDGKGASGHKKLARRLADLTIQARMQDGVTSGSLNPMWVEWLMGFPTGWTDLED